MTFSIILAHVVFVLSSIYLLIVAYNVCRTKTPLEQALGYHILWGHVLVGFLIWSVCGIYLWG